MKCSKAHKLISPYIDSELPESEMNALEGHIKDCFKCRKELEEGRELQNLLSMADIHKAPYGFNTRVMANLSPEKADKSSRFAVLAGLAEATAVIMVIAFGILSGSLVIKGAQPDRATDVIASLSLDVFDSAPPGSLGGVYLAMTEVRNEK
ncbi:MAG: zf-HC2 domain-containing protein [Nitrospirae bacterium]|nr:zf-HC2 domain-containing protein [Nitrospirota bacterium]